MTEEELLRQFLSAPPDEAEEESLTEVAATPNTGSVDKESELLAQFLQSDSSSSPTGSPVPAPREPEANFLEKAYNQARLGVSDFFSTMAGDTYGRGTDDPLEHTPVSLPFRPVAAAANVVRGGGAALGEVISAADEAIGNPLSKTMAWMAENKAKHPIYANSGLDQAVKDIEEWSPEYAPAIKDVAEVASAATAYLKPFRMTKGTEKVRNLPETVKKQQRTDIETRWAPERAFDEPGTVTEPGLMKTTKFTPEEGSLRARMYDELADIDELDPRASRANNFNVIDDVAEKMRVELDDALRYSDHMDMDKITAQLANVKKEVSKLPSMSATGARGASDAVFRAWGDIIKKYGGEGVITPRNLLQARRDLDAWLNKNRPKVLEAGTVTGEALAIKRIREAINDMVADAVPDAKVRESLARQNALLTARDEIRQAANSELGTNRFTRALGETQERYGLTMPHSPAAVGANLQPSALLVGGGLLGANTFGRGARRGANLLSAAATDAVQPIYNVGRGAIPATTLPEDEEVPEYLRRR